MIKNNKEKVFELKIQDDDELSGIDSISLVDEPAIEVHWVAFKKEHNFEKDEVYVQHLMTKGETEQDLLDQGWVVDTIDYLDGKEDFVETDPNAPSIGDEEEYKVRYKYILNPNIRGEGPIIPTTRRFCRELINQNKVFRIEDIDGAVNDFGQSPRTYRGSWNCRHIWSRIKYRNDAKIVNKASINIGKVMVGGFPSGMAPDPLAGQPSTITDRTRNNPKPSTVRNLGLSKEKLDIEPNPCWDGYEPIGLKDDGSPNCVPIKEDMQNPDVSGLPAYVDQIPKKKKKVLKPSLLDSFEYLNPKTDMSKQYFAADDEKHIVLGPAMIPDQKIFRKDDMGNPYYVFFSTDTIKMIAEKYMRNKYTDNNDTMHDGQAIKDIHVMESWIKESENDKSTNYGFGHLPVGTWFVSMKVNNLQVWEEIKQGKLNGFSVSGFFEEVADFSREDLFLSRLADMLKNIKE